MSLSPDYDVIVVGAGHNGLAATALLARRGLRVLCLEKNAYVGGMAGTRGILSGCRNDVGASLLFPLAKGVAEELELARYGVEQIDLPIMASNFNSTSSPPAIFYANPLRMAYVLRHFGVRAIDRLRAADGVLPVPGEPHGSFHAAKPPAHAGPAPREGPHGVDENLTTQGGGAA